MTGLTMEQPPLASQEVPAADSNDPFAATSATHTRFSHFDDQLFALGADTSPSQAKRALSAHLAETERRITEAGRLGNHLVQQRTLLADRLKEVEQQQNDDQITPELRQKLVEIEREYNEVGRESARAFLPKSRVSSNELPGSPFTSDTKRSTSPSKFESQATGSPTKLSVPNRKQRNQPANRVHDIEFATEISTSLLQQVRNLQSMLNEKEETIRSITRDKSKLEIEAEGFHQRLRTLDESESRYKDENWNLETQIHEFLAEKKESTDREKKLTHTLNILQSEKSAAQKELDEIKLSHARLSEDHTAAVKHHDLELGSLKRNMTMAENERGALQRRIDELTGQNQELAKAVAFQRGRPDDRDQGRGLSDEDFDTAPDNHTPEHSPPPSPTKGTPRHNMLETETLKSSLHHAHRMIQGLKSNIHREKTEKVELKRLLQEARDELDQRRSDLGSANGKRNRKVDSKEFKKPFRPAHLGGLRNSKSEIFVEDPNWEEIDPERSPSRLASAFRNANTENLSVEAETTDQFETANETSDAFETANERGTETEDFQTGAEDLSGSDELTETEAGPGSIRSRLSRKALHLPGNRQSFQSTASASGDEYSYEELRTPTTQPQRLRLKVSRGINRRSRAVSEEPSFQDSPASTMSSNNNDTPQAAGQTLFAELGNLSDEDDSVQGTPRRSDFGSAVVTPSSRPSTAKGTPAMPTVIPPVPKIIMIDCGTMTEPWNSRNEKPITAKAEVPQVDTNVKDLVGNNQPSEQGEIDVNQTAATKHLFDGEPSHLTVEEPTIGRPISASTYSDSSSQYDADLIGENIAKFPSPPSSQARNILAIPEALAVSQSPLSVSTIVSEHVEPVELRVPGSESLGHSPASLTFSSISSIYTDPIEPQFPYSHARPLVLSSQNEPHDRAEEFAVLNRTAMPTAIALDASSGRSRKKSAPIPVIAEDDTRQSQSNSPIVEMSESQRPFRELSNNMTSRVPMKPAPEVNDGSSQTMLTSEHIDRLLKDKTTSSTLIDSDHKSIGYQHGDQSSFGVVKPRLSHDSIGSVGRARSKMVDPDFIHDTVNIKRPSSAGSGRHNSISSVHPPLPIDHKQVIAAAAQRSEPGSGTPGLMGPPPLPASATAIKANPSFRPRTPSSQPPLSPTMSKPGIIPRPLHSSSGFAEIQSPGGTARSRKSSVSSFASEIETRFNMRQGLPVPAGMESGTDPRMINAITQTMIGEYLWKYTRKPGRIAMSDNRHRRYFWVHPYTRSLYWSDRDPSTAGRAELKAKSVPIEGVRVVTDDNPMPPGLHRKSLVIMTPGRTVKFTATTGQRHETWFNALSYLLLRTGDDAIGDTSEIATGALTAEDVAEFNPGYSRNANQPGRTSLSSYNSRTTRNASPAGHQSRKHQSQQPTLTETSISSRPTIGTFSRLSNYWKPSNSFSSRKSRHSVSGAGSFYEASEVHDSAEDLREMIEKQDRESDRLENVRACCDGKHDVGHLHTTSLKGRHASVNPPGTAPKLAQHGRNSVNRHTE